MAKVEEYVAKYENPSHTIDTLLDKEVKQVFETNQKVVESQSIKQCMPSFFVTLLFMLAWYLAIFNPSVHLMKPRPPIIVRSWI